MAPGDLSARLKSFLFRLEYRCKFDEMKNPPSPPVGYSGDEPKASALLTRVNESIVKRLPLFAPPPPQIPRYAATFASG